MSYLNGRLPSSALGTIYGGRLRRDAARAFNAMSHEALVRYGVQLRPTGPRSSYRTYAEQQQLWWNYQHGGTLAAWPGTSNHGWGLAVDLADLQMRHIVDAIGAKYGWAKYWSDAPSEWWHLKYRSGVWNGKDLWRTVHRGNVGAAVQHLKERLRAHGYTSVTARDPHFGAVCDRAVRAFQRAHGLKGDGVVGPATWRRLG